MVDWGAVLKQTERQTGKRLHEGLYEIAENEELIYVLFKDEDGYVHFQYCDDPLQTNHTMTETQLRKYQRVW